MEPTSSDINWTVIVVVAIAVLALLVFVLRRNRKDKKEMEETIKHVDEKPSAHDTNNEAKM
jgi:LPXTG-motif cell wall-anchored protein